MTQPLAQNSDLLRQESPLVLYQQVALPNPGSQVTLDGNKMRNPDERAMLVDEVRFGLPAFQSVKAGNVPTTPQQWWGAAVSARMRINRMWVTDDFVPVWALSEGYDLFFGREVAWTYVYRPPQPVFVPAGANLQCDLFVDPTIGAQLGGVTAYVAYACRSLPESEAHPVDVAVPYVGKWLPPTFPVGKLTSQRSRQNDLANPFAEDLHLQKIIGRVFTDQNAGASGGDASVLNPFVPGALTKVRMFGHNGAIVVRDFTPFSQLFPATDRVFRMNTVMDAKSYLLATLQCDLRDADNVGATGFSYAAAHLAAHGYRVVPYQSLTN